MGDASAIGVLSSALAARFADCPPSVQESYAARPISFVGDEKFLSVVEAGSSIHFVGTTYVVTLIYFVKSIYFVNGRQWVFSIDRRSLVLSARRINSVAVVHDAHAAKFVEEATPILFVPA